MRNRHRTMALLKGDTPGRERFWGQGRDLLKKRKSLLPSTIPTFAISTMSVLITW
jgi:hypothetical protein